jgi:hypothetical protein
MHMRNRAHKKVGLHKAKKIPKTHHKHYWPYIPVLLMVFATFALTIFKPVIDRNVLAYATEMSLSQLLEATNNQRINNGSEPLVLNSKLNEAAQAKADDMVNRNYWSHNTPDGKEPWVFFDNAGYKYFKAGENLAYGFSTSSATVRGWMNSPTHRDNLLDPDFTEVGFGFQNGSNFNNSGPETVVVAEYGRPQVNGSANANTQGNDNQQAAGSKLAVEESPNKSPSVLLNSNSTNIDAAPTIPVSRASTLTSGQSWLVFVAGLAAGIAITILLAKHAYQLQKVIRNAESFVLHHPVLDTVLVAVILIGVFLAQSTAYLL